MVAAFADKIPILGVCLGHQVICEVFGAAVTYAKMLMHGKSSAVTLNRDCPLFDGLPSVIQAARYHSLAAEPSTLPDALMVTTSTDDGEIMGVRHKDYAVFGVQFHPESILTPQGARIIQNFLAIN